MKNVYQSFYVTNMITHMRMIYEPEFIKQITDVLKVLKFKFNNYKCII